MSKRGLTFALSVFAGTVKEVYDKMLDSIKVKRSAPPNAWLWSLIEKCKSQDDIKLLFDILQKLRVFVSALAFMLFCLMVWWH